VIEGTEGNTSSRKAKVIDSASEIAKSNGAGSKSSKKSSTPSDPGDQARGAAMEVIVENNVEKAMKILKRKLIKEGLFRELKTRRYYEKPSEKKKRKTKDSLKKLRKEEARARKNPFF
jgi:small subunit ribosomal protein S21